MGFFDRRSRSVSQAQQLYDRGFKHYLDEEYLQALPLLRQAAELGSGEADSQLGIMYELGQGVPSDPAEAFRCFSRAAERGDSGGQYRLGRCYQQGIGVAIDKHKALYWHRQAAAQDNRLAPYAIDQLADEGVS